MAEPAGAIASVRRLWQLGRRRGRRCRHPWRKDEGGGPSSEVARRGRAAGRRRTLLVLALACAAALSPLSVSKAAANDLPEEVLGLWRTEPRSNGAFIIVRIEPCRGAPDLRCGTVARALAGARPDIVGEPILRNMRRRDETLWTGGEIIRPGKGEAYSSEMELTTEGLVVRGCVAGGLICGSQLWYRHP